MQNQLNRPRDIDDPLLDVDDVGRDKEEAETPRPIPLPRPIDRVPDDSGF